MSELVLGIGGNVADRLEWLQFTRNSIARQIGEIIKESGIVESAPWGFKTEIWFLNQVLLVDTEMAPEKVIRAIHMIEQEAGRVRSGTYSDRTVDIDILLYDDLVLNTDYLEIPHPMMLQRRFVLEPLAAICPDRIHPVRQEKIKDLLLQLNDDEELRWLKL